MFYPRTKINFAKIYFKTKKIETLAKKWQRFCLIDFQIFCCSDVLPDVRFPPFFCENGFSIFLSLQRIFFSFPTNSRLSNSYLKTNIWSLVDLIKGQRFTHCTEGERLSPGSCSWSATKLWKWCWAGCSFGSTFDFSQGFRTLRIFKQLLLPS